MFWPHTFESAILLLALVFIKVGAGKHVLIDSFHFDNIT
jgi:hypothetical protein